MKLLLISLLLLMATTVEAQSSRYAVIEVRPDSTTGETLYLTRYRAPMLDNVVVDSARMDRRGFYHLVVTPDPQARYRIQLGDGDVAYQAFLAPGDSLVYLDRYRKEDTLVYDKIGANRAFSDPSTQPRSQWHFYEAMGNLDWDAAKQYVAKYRSRMERTADSLQKLYPKHIAMTNAIRSAAIRWYFEPQLRFLSRYYDDSTYIPSVDPHFSIIDSIPWRVKPFSHSDEAWYLANE